MAKQIVIAANTPGAGSIREMFAALGNAAEIRNDAAGLTDGGPGAILLGFDERILDKVDALRKTGFQGILFVLGRASADLEVRQRLAELRAWFLPAFSGPGDVVSRIRQML